MIRVVDISTSGNEMENSPDLYALKNTYLSITHYLNCLMFIKVYKSISIASIV